MEGNGHSETAIPVKDLFRIGEVSRLTATKPFVLRYWESEFPMLQPVKSPKGHRLYRREDIDTVLRIKRLLYDEGFTIVGARRFLREQGESNGDMPLPAEQHPTAEASAGTFADNSAQGPAEKSAPLNRQMLLDLRDSLRSFLTLLEGE
jgi:DNA-binding transcriptional MerR regulator